MKEKNNHFQNWKAFVSSTNKKKCIPDHNIIFQSKNTD